MKYLLLFFKIMVMCATAFALPQNDSVHIYFELNNESITKREQAKIDSLLYNDIFNNRTNILIVGYADFLGSEEHNLGLSERRAKAIQQYLVGMQIPVQNIRLCIGKGEINRNSKSPDGYAPDRRVDIVYSRINTQGSVTNNVKNSPSQPTKKAATDYSVLTKMKAGQIMRLENIYFLLGRHVVTEESVPQLDKLYEIMDDNPNLKIQIEGHVCCLKYGFDALDDDTQENTLSLNRAKFIYEYLVRKGIDKERLRYIGFGRTRPLAKPELTPKDEDLNRRVEIRVLQQ